MTPRRGGKCTHRIIILSRDITFQVYPAIKEVKLIEYLEHSKAGGEEEEQEEAVATGGRTSSDNLRARRGLRWYVFRGFFFLYI